MRRFPNAETVVNLLDFVSGNKQTRVGFDGHKDDFVNRVISGNDSTYEIVPSGSNAWKKALKILINSNNVHTCLGDASDACQKFYGSFI